MAHFVLHLIHCLYSLSFNHLTQVYNCGVPFWRLIPRVCLIFIYFFIKGRSAKFGSFWRKEFFWGNSI